MTRHDHRISDRDPLTRENCGACVLNGYVSREDRADRKANPASYCDGPNYAGWARVYVQASRMIPVTYHTAFRAERASTNLGYALALERDILSHGLRGIKYQGAVLDADHEGAK